MNHVILGAGPAGVIAAETIRKHAPNDRIVIVGDEPEAPYSRMALPYLLALACAANIGSAATLIGNPQNMLVGLASGIPYARFFAAQAPVAALGLAVDFAVVAWVYRRDLAQPFRARPHPRVKVHGFLLAKGLAAALLMVGFFFAGAGIEIVALTAAAALLEREMDWRGFLRGSVVGTAIGALRQLAEGG